MCSYWSIEPVLKNTPIFKPGRSREDDEEWRFQQKTDITDPTKKNHHDIMTYIIPPGHDTYDKLSILKNEITPQVIKNDVMKKKQ